MSTVVIIANPASGKDIRRLVAHASVFDTQEKVRMVRRLLLGLEAAGVARVAYMPEVYDIVPRALEAIRPAMEVADIKMAVTHTLRDTVAAARAAEAMGAGVMVVLGGDGTSRAACKGSVRVPILPLSTGTNNVFPFMVESTTAGLAAGVVASGRFPVSGTCTRSTLLEVLLDGQPADIALVDVAVYDGLFTASKAVWDMEKVPQLFLSRCRADSIGLSSVGGQIARIEPGEPRGLALDLGPDGASSVHALIASGCFARVGVRRSVEMVPDEPLPVALSPCLLAVDNEREVMVGRGRVASVCLRRQGPFVVDVDRTLELARRAGMFVRTAQSGTFQR